MSLVDLRRWVNNASARVDLPSVDTNKHTLRLVMDADNAAEEANENNVFQVSSRGTLATGEP